MTHAHIPHVLSTTFVRKANPELTQHKLQTMVTSHNDLVVYRSSPHFLSTAILRERFPELHANCLTLIDAEHAAKQGAE